MLEETAEIQNRCKILKTEISEKSYQNFKIKCCSLYFLITKLTLDKTVSHCLTLTPSVLLNASFIFYSEHPFTIGFALGVTFLKCLRRLTHLIGNKSVDLGLWTLKHKKRKLVPKDLIDNEDEDNLCKTHFDK